MFFWGAGKFAPFGQVTLFTQEAPLPPSWDMGSTICIRVVAKMLNGAM